MGGRLGCVAIVAMLSCGDADTPVPVDLEGVPESTGAHRRASWTWQGPTDDFDGFEGVVVVGDEVVAVGTVEDQGVAVRFGLDGHLRDTEILVGPQGELAEPLAVAALGERLFVAGVAGLGADACWVAEVGGFDLVVPDTVPETACTALDVVGGEIHVLGTVAFPERDTLLVELDLEGTVKWTRQLDLSADASDEIATGIVRTALGFAISGAGRTDGALRWQVVGLDGLAEPVWTYAPTPGGSSSWADDVVLLADGDLWVVGMETTETGEGAWNTVRLGPDGEERWRQRIPAAAFGAASAGVVTDAGTLVGVGFQSHGQLDSRRRIWLREVSSSAELVWRELAVDAPSLWDEAKAVAVDANGGVVVAGFVTGPDVFHTGAWLRRYDLAQ